MRVALVVGLSLLAGCIQVDLDEDATGDNGGSSQSQECINGVCRTCVDGVCSGPLEDLRQEAAKPHDDVDVHETHDLATDVDGASWSFWVDANATGHLVVRVVDPATEEVGLVPSACVTWERRGASSQDSGSTGNCSGGANVNVVISGVPLSDGTLLSWQTLTPGHHTLSVSALPQPNHLVVDIVVDNP
jgi:hypothetical protein